MAISLQSIVVRSARRIRLHYTNTLAAGAFNTSWFSLVSLDSASSDPVPVQALLVSGQPYEIELALSLDLAPGANYQLTSSAGIPATDASTSLAEVTPFWTPAAKRPPSATVTRSDLTALLYGEDLTFDGTDLVETPDGDLDITTGPDNAMNAVVRRMLGNGLPYNPDYGPHLREAVDGAPSLLGSYTGKVERQARQDDRVKSVKVSVGADDNSGDVELRADVAFIGGQMRTITENLT